MGGGARGSERRQHPRSVLGMPVEAIRRHLPECHPERVVGLHVTNLSRGGVRAESHRPLPPAEPITLFLPPLGPDHGQDTRGRVVRCDAAGDRWAIGIAFEEPLPEGQGISAP
jgi:hypothetical protein